MILQKLLLSEKKRIIPSSKRIDSVVRGVVEVVNSSLKKAKLKAECVTGGSYAKGTILKDDFDVDLFVRFDYSYHDKDISKLLQAAIRTLKPDLVHGSRDYFQFRKGKILFELIPVLRIENYKQALNVTDMSPLHVGYVRKQFDKKKGLADEVRLAKQFCKGIGVYGAESYIRGFSGHVLDLLVIYYGSFQNFLMQASLWGERVVIDVEHHWKDPLKALNTSKTISPLVIVDPIQPDRNAAAAVSQEKFSIFKSKAREFLRLPSDDYFRVKRLSVKDLKKLAGKNKLLIVRAKPVVGKDDVVGTKLLKSYDFLVAKLKKYGFHVLKSDWEYSRDGLFYFIVKDELLSKNVLLKGPPVSDIANALNFKRRHRIVIEKGGVLYAEEKREHFKPDLLLKVLLKDPYLKDKAKQFSLS